MPTICCPHCGHVLRPDELDNARFDSHVEKSDGCWEWTGARHPFGYGAFGARAKNYGAHRWQWERYHGPIPKGMAVLHECDNASCVRPDHLRLGTQSDNVRDKMARGRHRYRSFSGAEHPRAKLTDEDVREIRRLHVAGMGYRRLAARYGMGRSSIAKIVRRENWRHLGD